MSTVHSSTRISICSCPAVVEQTGLDAVRLELVRTFVVLSQEGHFGRTGARLFLSTSGLSRRITQLERAARQELFLRMKNRVQLTDSGVRLLPLAVDLLHTTDAAWRSLCGTEGEPPIRSAPQLDSLCEKR